MSIRVIAPRMLRSTMFVLLITIMLWVSIPNAVHAAEGDITFDLVPSTNQLYPRDLSTNQADIEVRGTVVIPGRTEVVLRITRDGSPFSEVTTPLAYSGDGTTAFFSLTTTLSAGTYNYAMDILTRGDGGEERVRLVSDIVVGDVYLINGQSNAMAWQNYADDSASDSRDELIRTIGATSHISETVVANQTWIRATGDGYRVTGSIGQWGLHFAKLVVENHDMPVAILNQGHGGKGIQFFQRNDSDPTDLNTNYGRLLYRADQAGVTDRARAMLWYQGEADSFFAEKHEEGFENVHAAWQQDFGRLERVYIHQVRNGCNGVLPEMLEVQRSFADSLSSPDVIVLSTNGLNGHDGCHFRYTDGYRTIAEQLYDVVAEELYARPAEPNTYPPNLDTARLDSGNTEIVLQMQDGDDPLTFDGGAESDFLLECAPEVAVTGGTVAGNTIRLALNGDGSAIKSISYIGHIGEGPWITNGKDVGMLSFKYELDSSNRPPSVAVGNIPNETLYAVGAPINIEAEVDDCDGIITRVWFYANGTELHTMPKGPWAFSWTDAPAGTHEITIEARDDTNERILSAPISITVVEPVGVNLNAPAVGDVYLEGTAIAIEAAVTDESTAAEVQFFNGDELIGTTTSSPWSIIWEGAPLGNHVLKAVARSIGGGITESIPVAMRVTQAPTVSITEPTEDAIYLEGRAIQIVADAIDDNAIAQVEFFANDQSIGVDTEAPWSATLLDTTPGGYTVQAIATDDDGFSTTSGLVPMGVRGLPQISLTAPPTGTRASEGGSVLLTADASVIRGTIVQVVFHIDGTATYTDTEAPWEAEWNNLIIGEHQVSAIATDDLGNTAETGVVQVSVKVAAQVAVDVSTQEAVAGEGLSFTANFNRDDIAIVAMAFYAGETLLFTDESAPYEFTWSDGQVGTHLVNVVATDSTGATFESDSIPVRFLALPTIALSADQTSVSVGTSVSITAQANDEDGTVREVQLFNGDTLVGTDMDTPYTFVLDDLGEGPHTLSAVVIDNDDQSSRSEALTISVQPLAMPTVSLAAEQTEVKGGAPVTVTVQAADADGTISKVELYDGETLVGTDVDAPYQFVLFNLAEGSHNLSAVATDDDGLSTTSDTVAVEVVVSEPVGTAEMEIFLPLYSGGDAESE